MVCCNYAVKGIRDNEGSLFQKMDHLSSVKIRVKLQLKCFPLQNLICKVFTAHKYRCFMYYFFLVKRYACKQGAYIQKILLLSSYWIYLP